jgi:hypothetical protein
VYKTHMKGWVIASFSHVIEANQQRIFKARL